MQYGDNVIFPQESYAIIGAAMKVHSTLGCGFTEKVYQDALAVEFNKNKIPFQREMELHVVYDDIELPSTFIPDFICYDKIIVELKAVRELDDMHRSQAYNYAKVSGYQLALLVNFGEPSLTYERLVV
ncbi:GxxExxY protein [Prevotellaceae bacterium MN60]|nr:GxxExxY protein [Prevotellaceae bacterium MN60]